MYPVQVAFTKEPSPDYVKEAAQVAWNINRQVRAGQFAFQALIPSPNSKALVTSSYFLLVVRKSRDA